MRRGALRGLVCSSRTLPHGGVPEHLLVVERVARNVSDGVEGLPVVGKNQGLQVHGVLVVEMVDDDVVGLGGALQQVSHVEGDSNHCHSSAVRSEGQTMRVGLASDARRMAWVVTAASSSRMLARKIWRPRDAFIPC